MAPLNQFRPIEINLYQTRTSEYQGGKVKYIIIGGVFALFMAVIVIWGISIQNDVDQYDLQISQENAKMATYQQQLQQMNAGGRLDVWADLPKSLRRGEIQPLKLMRDFASNLPEDATVTNFQLQKDHVLNCTIDFGSTDAFTTFKATMDSSSEFSILNMDNFVNQQVTENDAGVSSNGGSTSYVPINTVQFQIQVIIPDESAQGGTVK